MQREMQRLYNSGFEIEPRILLISCTYSLPSFSEDMFSMLDFMAIYSNEFAPGVPNLHGDNSFKFSEVAAKKESVRAAIKRLVCEGFLNVIVEKGFTYQITDSGKKYADSLESSYAIQYKYNLLEIQKRYSNYTEQDLSVLIREKAVKSGREEV